MTTDPKCRGCRRPLKTDRERNEGICTVCRVLPKPQKPASDGGGSTRSLMAQLKGTR